MSLAWLSSRLVIAWWHGLSSEHNFLRAQRMSRTTCRHHCTVTKRKKESERSKSHYLQIQRSSLAKPGILLCVRLRNIGKENRMSTVVRRSKRIMVYSEPTKGTSTRDYKPYKTTTGSRIWSRWLDSCWEWMAVVRRLMLCSYNMAVHHCIWLVT